MSRLWASARTAMTQWRIHAYRDKQGRKAQEERRAQERLEGLQRGDRMYGRPQPWS